MWGCYLRADLSFLGWGVEHPPWHLIILVVSLAVGVFTALHVVQRILRARAKSGQYRSALWWALSVLPIAAACVAYRVCFPVGSGWWWTGYAVTGTAALAWVLYGVFRAIPMLRRLDRERRRDTGG
jgi:predicted TIM-barrel fold metal-dependent hydrolase